jgi:hypothetical protein
MDEKTLHAARAFTEATFPLIILAVAATVARVFIKVQSALPFRWDDWLIAAGCVRNVRCAG